MLTKVEIVGVQPQTLSLPIGGGVNQALVITKVDGLGPVKANVNITPFGSLDGGAYYGSSVGSRNIVISLALSPNWVDQTPEELRKQVYLYLMPKLPVKVRFLSTHLPTVSIDGVVESCEPAIFAKDPEIQVSIICPTPDFVAVDETIINGIVRIDGDNIPATSITYNGNVPTGFKLRINPSASRPSYSGWITNYNTSLLETGYYQTTSVTIDANGYYELFTRPGNKYVRRVLASSYTNLLRYQLAGSIWQKLYPGSNLITPMAQQSGLGFVLSYFSRFGGL